MVVDSFLKLYSSAPWNFQLQGFDWEFKKRVKKDKVQHIKGLLALKEKMHFKKKVLSYRNIIQRNLPARTEQP